MKSKLSITGTALVLALMIQTPAMAHGIDSKSVAWGLGGLMAGSMYSDSKNKKEAREGSYYTEAVPVTVTRAAPASQSMTPEQKMQQLNKLAAGGYITPAEYKAEKQAILNSIAD
ncbi:MAG: hypothetical protein AAGA91_13860 [Pseudomonadota bacterium]